MAVLKKADIQFGDKLNVLSGESGAGKSVLIKSIQAICGEKIDSSFIRKNEEEIYIEAFFRPTKENLLHLSKQHPDYIKDTNNEIVLARIIKRSSPSRALINGRSCSSSVLSEVTQKLISLTGQHASRNIISKGFQLDLLDDFAGLSKEKKELGIVWKEIKKSTKELNDIKAELSIEEDQISFWKSEVDLFDKIEPLDEEVKLLEEELLILESSEKIKENTYKARESISGDNGINDSLALVVQYLDFDLEDFNSLKNEIEEIKESLYEISSKIDSYVDGIESNPERLAEVEARLSVLVDLCRRHQVKNVKEVYHKIERYRNKLILIENSSYMIKEKEERIKELKTEYSRLSENISNKRHKSIKPMQKELERELHALGLEGSVKIILTKTKDSQIGNESAEFLLQANKNLDFAALNKGVSGGELSRVNLALLLINTSPGVSSYVFDEIDAGIGGETANRVAKKIKSLAEKNQIIVITHLSQIAKLADKNFLIDKNEDSTNIIELDKQGVQKELARLIGVGDEMGLEVSRLLT